MKLFSYCKSVILLRIAVNVYGDDPPQKMCHELIAVKRNAELGQKIFETLKYKTMVLWKVTKMDDYHNHFGGNQNYCSIFHFGPDCKASRRNVRAAVDGLDRLSLTEALRQGEEKVKEIYRSHTEIFVYWTTYNEKTNNVAQIRYKVKDQDPHYSTAELGFRSMDQIKSNLLGGTIVTPVQRYSIPESVMKPQMYARIAVAPHFNWFIFRTCDKKITWVELIFDDGDLSSDQEKILDVYKKEVDEKLVELGIDITTMTDFLPLQFPFKSSLPIIVEETGSKSPWLQNALKNFETIQNK